jgi:hypothetical protein
MIPIPGWLHKIKGLYTAVAAVVVVDFICSTALLLRVGIAAVLPVVGFQIVALAAVGFLVVIESSRLAVEKEKEAWKLLIDQHELMRTIVKTRSKEFEQIQELKMAELKAVTPEEPQ